MKKISISDFRLNDREYDIIQKRFILFPRKTRKQLAIEHNVIPERIRQIEHKAFMKIWKFYKFCLLYFSRG